eukprot:23420_6
MDRHCLLGFRSTERDKLFPRVFREASIAGNSSGDVTQTQSARVPKNTTPLKPSVPHKPHTARAKLLISWEECDINTRYLS